MKNRKKLIIIIFPIALLLFMHYIFVLRYDKCYLDKTTDTITKDGTEFIIAKSTPSSFLEEKERTIGIIKSSDFLSSDRSIVKIKNIDANEIFLVCGLMNDGFLYLKKDRIAELNEIFFPSNPNLTSN